MQELIEAIADLKKTVITSTENTHRTIETVDTRLELIDRRLTIIEQRLGRIEKCVSHENFQPIRHFLCGWYAPIPFFE